MKPPIESLGVNAALSVHEHALRVAQKTIDELREDVKRLEGELLSSLTQQLSDRGKKNIMDRIFKTPTAIIESDSPIMITGIHAAAPAQRVPVEPIPHEI